MIGRKRVQLYFTMTSNEECLWKITTIEGKDVGSRFQGEKKWMLNKRGGRRASRGSFPYRKIGGSQKVTKGPGMNLH